MRNLCKIFFLVVALLPTPFMLLAQDDDKDKLPGQDLTVYSDVKPVLQEAEKKNLTPDLPEVDEQQPELNYSFEDQSIEVPYESPEVRPLAMRAEKLENFKNVLAKVGFGNVTTPFVEVYLNSGRNKKYRRGDNNSNLGAYVKYISQNSNRQDQLYSDFRSKVFGNIYTDKIFFTPYLGFDRDGNRFFGYNAETDTVLASMDNKQVFNYVYGGTRFGNAEETYYDINYNGKVDVGYLSDYFGQSEINPQALFNIGKTFNNGHELNGHIMIDYTRLSIDDTTSATQFLVGLNPTYKLYKETWFVEGGLNLGSDDQGFYIFPDLYFERELVDELVVFHAELTGRTVKNNYRTLSNENPFLDFSPAIHSSRELGVKAGLRGAPMSGMSYNVHARYNNVRFMPFYLNDTLMPNRFNVVYDTSTNVLNLHLEAGYNLSEKFRFLASFDYFNYSTREQFKPWHQPTIKFSLLSQYHITDRLMAEANIYALNSMWARNEELQAIEIPGVVDVNIGASYKINDSFHIFARVNNIAAANYQKWYRYPTYGINGLGGIKMIF